ncbi:MAG: exonuclease domain-containing protein, partial [Intestinibacter sp.]|uniref:exonuclease domain-containing protein n=1 Tax=Intestinibacter sp. TaxID=1965304 RepID=UPI002A827BAE
MEKRITSIVKNVVFLDIETSGLNPKNSEILEIGAVKIDRDKKISIFNTLVKNKSKVPPEIFSLCKNLNQKDLDKAPLLDEVKKDFLAFIEDKTLICHNKNFEKEFLNLHIGKINNKFIDSMELAAILEPFHREFNLDYLKKAITKNKDDEVHRAIYDVIDTIDVVNALILRFKDRLEKDNKLTLYPLTFDIDSYLNKHSLENWDWSEYINNADYDLKDETNTVYEKKEDEKQKNDNSKEEEIFKLMGKYNASYEELLKEENIWGSKKGFIYEFRQGQYDLTKLIRKTFHSTSNNIACIEAPTGIGKSVGYLLPAVLEARYAQKRIIISTATKELQVQLMDKDLPNVINSLGLSGKVSYGYIKGKNNYICKSKFYDYKKDYEAENPTYEDIMS